jgi:integrase
MQDSSGRWKSNVKWKVKAKPYGGKRQALTQDELDRLFAALKNNRHGHRDYMIALVTFLHGLRVSELIDLRWDDIDWRKGTIAKHHQIRDDEPGAIEGRLERQTLTVPGPWILLRAAANRRLMKLFSTDASALFIAWSSATSISHFPRRC